MCLLLSPHGFMPPVKGFQKDKVRTQIYSLRESHDAWGVLVRFFFISKKVKTQAQELIKSECHIIQKYIWIN